MFRNKCDTALNTMKSLTGMKGWLDSMVVNCIGHGYVNSTRVMLCIFVVGFHDSGSLRALVEVSGQTTIFFFFVMLQLYATEDEGCRINDLDLTM